jgi:putative cardiolipin synthase
MRGAEVRRAARLGVVLGASAALLTGCGALPPLDNRTSSTAVLATLDTTLGRAIGPLAEAHPNKSGIYPLPDGRDAFAARALLARAAERTLDIQYYIWRNDMTGTLLFDALRAAADRGVRVRLLLDDNPTAGLDPTLATLDAHPNIEVRLFNPLAIRRPRWIGYVTDFSRLNRRMHNKSFTVDNQVTIIGGRNIGDEYFDAAEGLLFVDLDVLAVGPVVTDVSLDFDRYWASASSYPVAGLIPPASAAEIAELSSAALVVERDPGAEAYVRALRDTPFVTELLNRNLALEWDPTRMVSDDPAKGLGLASPEATLREQLKRIIGEPASKTELVAAYFVPTAAGVDSFVAMANRGVKIRILTNSLEATDGFYVHAGYAKRRKPLLEAGIELYEMRSVFPDAAKKRSASFKGSSASSLHAKTFSTDGSSVFIGSFNFDPRSRNLNTELGFVIHSPSLAQKIESAFDTTIPASSYRVHLSGTGRLYWTEHLGGVSRRYDTEPHTSFWLRAAVWFVSLLPVEWLL